MKTKATVRVRVFLLIAVLETACGGGGNGGGGAGGIGGAGGSSSFTSYSATKPVARGSATD